jgi:hypothetical protein
VEGHALISEEVHNHVQRGKHCRGKQQGPQLYMLVLSASAHSAGHNEKHRPAQHGCRGKKQDAGRKH